MLDVDVLVIGAGPAGIAAALGLAANHRVAVIDRLAEPVDRIGETLPAAAGPLLASLGAHAVLDLDHHQRTQARRSIWGGPQPVELDGLRDPDGLGWRLDRRTFERQLRTCAQDRGVHLVAPARAHTVRRDRNHWLIPLAGGSVQGVRAAVLIDAGGRSSRLMRPWTGPRHHQDRLLCAWTYAPLRAPAASITYIEGAPNGWWYTAPLPGGRRVLAFHTDADLRPRATLVDALTGRATSTLRAALADADLGGADPVRVCPASGGRTRTLAGDGWLTVGDASMSFDPLSSQGLFHALYTGHAAARTAAGMLSEMPEVSHYAATLERVWAAYCAHRADFYALERRWPDASFWSRRVPAQSSARQ